MKYVILGTAGHIDHGKTTLIKALTGRDTDNLEEEKRRGISINLGFTYFDLPNGDRVGIIDAPGHERFVKNMMSGTVGVDIVLMIIAADDGVMPQTLEHAEILTFMGVKSSIIVITKCDTVDEDILDLVEEDIKESLSSTILKDSPIVKVDSISKRGFDELISLIEKKALEIEEDDFDFNTPTRLNVDRSFSLKGHGTIITGTLIEGYIDVNEKYELYPSKKEVKIRSIEVHGQNVQRALRGQRTAINITNLSKDEINRGDIIASKNSLVESKIIDAKISLSVHTDIVLEHWSRVRVFHGTREILARIVPLDKKTVEKGENAFVQLRLEEAIYCKINDKFVIRSYSPVNTIGGGIVIDTVSKKFNIRDTDHLNALLEKEKFGLKEMIYDYINRVDFGTSFEDIYSYTGQIEGEINKNLSDLIKDEKIFKVNDLYFSDNYLNNIIEKMNQLLTKYHKEFPLEAGLKKEELREKVARQITAKDFNSLLALKAFKGNFKSDTLYVSKKDFQIDLSGDKSKLADDILNRMKEAEPGLLKDSDFTSNVNEKKTLTFLLKGQVKKLDNFVIRSEYYNKIKNTLIEYLEKNKEISIAEFRDLNGFSRKIALAILEEFDKNKITKRGEDTRSLYK